MEMNTIYIFRKEQFCIWMVWEQDKKIQFTKNNLGDTDENDRKKYC